MLIFLKSARGLHKNAHFFPIFLTTEYSYSIVSKTKQATVKKGKEAGE